MYACMHTCMHTCMYIYILYSTYRYFKTYINLIYMPFTCINLARSVALSIFLQMINNYTNPNFYIIRM